MAVRMEPTRRNLSIQVLMEQVTLEEMHRMHGKEVWYTIDSHKGDGRYHCNGPFTIDSMGRTVDKIHLRNHSGVSLKAFPESKVTYWMPPK